MNIDWNKLSELPWWIILIPCAVFWFITLYVGYLKEYRAGRWEPTKSNELPAKIFKTHEDGCMVCGFISIFASGFIYVKYDFNWFSSIPLGIMVGVATCYCITSVFSLCRKLIIMMIERKYGRPQ